MDGLYRALADGQRRRMLNLLWEGPLCVCFLQEILGEGQVKMSKQLAYLKKAGLVEATREGTWMIYRLVTPTPGMLGVNLEAWRGEAVLGDRLRQDLDARAAIIERLRAAETVPSGVVAGCRGKAAGDEADEEGTGEAAPAGVGRMEDPWNDFPL